MRQRDRTSLWVELWRAAEIQYSSLSVLARSRALRVSESEHTAVPSASLAFHAKASFLLDCHLSVYCIHSSIRREKPKAHSPPSFLPPTLAVISCTSIILYLLHSALELHCGTQAVMMQMKRTVMHMSGKWFLQSVKSKILRLYYDGKSDGRVLIGNLIGLTFYKI